MGPPRGGRVGSGSGSGDSPRVKLEDSGIPPNPAPTQERPGRGGNRPVSQQHLNLQHQAQQQIPNHAGYASLPMNGDVGNASKGSLSDVGASAGVPSGPSEFIKKLYKMLEEESATYGKGKPVGQPRGEGAKRGSVGWGRGGSTFVVWDMNDFTTKVL